MEVTIMAATKTATKAAASKIGAEAAAGILTDPERLKGVYQAIQRFINNEVQGKDPAQPAPDTGMFDDVMTKLHDENEVAWTIIRAFLARLTVEEQMYFRQQISKKKKVKNTF